MDGVFNIKTVDSIFTEDFGIGTLECSLVSKRTACVYA